MSSLAGAELFWTAEIAYRTQTSAGFFFRAALAAIPKGQGGLMIVPGVGVGVGF